MPKSWGLAPILMIAAQVDTFIDHLRNDKQYSENTILAYRNDLMQFTEYLRAADGPLTVEKVQAYTQNLQEQGYASSTIARKVAAIKTFLSYLHMNNHIDQDIAASITTPKVDRQIQQVLTPEQIARLLNVPMRSETPKNLRDRVLLDLLYRTDLRINELVELECDDFDGQNLVLTQESSQRIVNLPQETREHLQAYISGGRPFLMKGKGGNALFLNHRGSVLTRQGLWLIIKESAEKAGLEVTVTPHMLRRSYEAHQQAARRSR